MNKSNNISVLTCNYLEPKVMMFNVIAASDKGDEVYCLDEELNIIKITDIRTLEQGKTFIGSFCAESGKIIGDYCFTNGIENFYELFFEDIYSYFGAIQKIYEKLSSEEDLKELIKNSLVADLIDESVIEGFNKEQLKHFMILFAEKWLKIINKLSEILNIYKTFNQTKDNN